MPCGDKVDSYSPVFNPGWRNYAKGTLTKLYSFGEDGSNLVRRRKGLGFKSLIGMTLPSSLWAQFSIYVLWKYKEVR